jgi:opacity protein-like surface antigen
MARAKIFTLAGAAALLSTAAMAADLPPLPPPVYRPPVVVETGGFYILGFVGVSEQRFDQFQFTHLNPGDVGPWPPSWRIDQKDLKDTAFVGFGIGYQWNNWFRIDFTGEHRTSSKGKAIGSYDFPWSNPPGRGFDVFDFDHQASVFLFNAYVDLGTWWCVTPFIGAGVGSVRHKVSAITDFGPNPFGVGFGLPVVDQEETKWTTAWAVHAGLAYNVTNTFKVEFAYRYLNMGNADTPIIECQNTPTCFRAFYTLNKITSNDFRIGFRWLLQPEAPAPVLPPPLIRKG